MDAFNRLQFHIMQDEMSERWQNFQKHFAAYFQSMHQNQIGISITEASHESEGRVWVEVGNEGLRLRVTHLHPANPSVSEALRRKCTERREALSQGKDNSILTGKLIYPPEDDKISLSSLEDYWFNHWQGPYITADSNQNNYSIPKLRRSHRKSKRSNRCSICQKKLVRAELEDSEEGPCLEREKNVLAHMPSVKIDTRILKEEFEDRSDDEISKSSVSEDALSRCSASDEQLTRMHRIVDNELRTSFSLFIEEAVSTDVIDATVSMDTSDKLLSPSTRFLSPPISPRQSRSCPCSPKMYTRTYSSPESISSSPKSRSFVGISKFSLSSSLLAIHRQASLMPEFLRFDTGKSESPGASKTSSLHNSLKSEARKVRHTLSDAAQVYKDDSWKFDAHSSKVDESNNESCGSSNCFGSYTKHPLHETQSLPPLKLSKMSLTYRGGVIISEENEAFDSGSFEEEQEEEEESDQGTLESASSASQPKKPNAMDAEEIDNSKMKNLLPDVVPLSETTVKDDASVASSTQEGVINLGFDGSGESSDFVESTREWDKLPHPSITISMAQNDGQDFAAAAPPSISEACKSKHRNTSTTDIPMIEIENLSAGSASNAAILNLESGTEEAKEDPSQTLPLGEKYSNEEQSAQQQQKHDTFIEKDVMQEAREMVFWWRKNNPTTADESEFCLHETECKVKQKPLLMFLHGIGSSADVWNQQLWYFLSCGYEIVAPDLLGHGLSSAPKDKKYYRFSQMLDYISLVFDLFVPQGRKCIVIGHNYGCALAVALARGRPTSVGLVVLASCGGPSPLVPHTKYENALNSTLMRFLNPFITCGCLSRELLYTPRGKHYPVVASDSTGVPSTPRYVVEHTAQGQHWPEGDLAFHRRLTIPALLLYGMKDQSISFVEMCEMEKTIPRAFLELIPGAGHELMTDCAEEVCHAMHRFVRRWKQHI